MRNAVRCSKEGEWREVFEMEGERARTKFLLAQPSFHLVQANMFPCECE
jgi:hypothetical protein